MKFNYTAMAALCLVASVPLVIVLLQRRSASLVPVVRFASFNAAMNRGEPGALLAELRGGSEQAARIAELVQRAQADVLLLCELDRDEAGAAAIEFRDRYLAVSQNGQPPIDFAFVWCTPVNAGDPSGHDLDGDGDTAGPGDAFGYGAFPGQYGMALLSRHPILEEDVRTFRTLKWSAMPGALRPDGLSDETWQQMRLSSKSHWDVPIGIGDPHEQPTHVLCSHPTPPVFDGPEDRNGRRNHDEIRFWVDYLTPGRGDWIVDDQGVRGGLPEAAAFVLMGDLNCDPVDGESRREALASLVAHPRVHDPAPRSIGAVEAKDRQWGVNPLHEGDPALDTGDFPDEPPAGPGNLRVDYVLPASSLTVVASGVLWPPAYEPVSALLTASDHRLVWVDVAVR